MNKFGIWISLLLLLLVSCKSGKQLNKNTSYKPVSNIELNKPVQDYKWLQAKGKVSFKDQDNQQVASLVLVIRHDSLIWGSINAVMGFEIFRFYITRDSMYLIDRPSKKYYGFSIRDIMTRYAWKEAGFDVFEKILFASTIFKIDEHYLPFKDETTGAPYFHNQDMILDKKIYPGNKKLPVSGYILTRMDNSQRININYKDEISTQNFYMPAIVDLKYFTPQEFSLNLTFSSIRFIQYINLNTAIPEGYEKGN
jgi:hypothetical protein